MIEILDHYNAVKGGLIPFALPTIVWSGNENANEFTLPGDAWRYQQPPDVEEIFCGGYVVQVALESVPGEGVGLLGADFTVTVALIPGAAAAASGAVLTVQTLLEIGVGRAPGAAETIDATLTPGAASGGIAGIGPPIFAEVQTLLIPGFAFAGLSRTFNVTTGLVAGNAANITDPDYLDVELLIHGWNGFVDNSLRQRAITANNSNVVLTSAGPRFGSQSIAVPSGNNDNYAKLGGNVTIQRPWTVEAWIYLTTFTFGPLISCITPVTNTGTNDSLQVTTTGRLLVRAGSASDESLQTDTNAIKLDTWHHVAASADETTLRLFVDGELLASRSRPSNRDYALTLGQVGPRVNRLQEFRLTAKCRYTATFAKPLMSFSSLAGITHGALDGIASTVTATRTGGTATGAADTAGIAETVDVTLAEGAASSP
jgi:hypothetical protein